MYQRLPLTRVARKMAVHFHEAEAEGVLAHEQAGHGDCLCIYALQHGHCQASQTCYDAISGACAFEARGEAHVRGEHGAWVCVG